MKRTSLRKYSVLGLVLLGASAVTAAVIPSKVKSDAKSQEDNGIKTESSGGGLNTCRPTVGEEVSDCDYTVTGVGIDLSATTADAGGLGTLTNSDTPQTGSSTTA